MKQLTVLACDKAKATGKVYLIPDGGSLYLRVAKSGSKSWVWRYRHEGKLHEAGLGPYPRTGLAEARKAANKLRDARDRGRGDNPHPLARAETQATFGRIADTYINDKIAPALSSKQVADWISRLAKLTRLRPMPVDKVTTQDVLADTNQWADAHKTRKDVLDRIRKVLDAAASAGYRDPALPNPARWKGHLENLVPAAPKRPEAERHHASMPWENVPQFMAQLSVRPETAARALEFAILCGGRTGEVTGDYFGKPAATWGEIDLGRHLWTISADRMKMGRDHVVPLSAAAVSLLQALPRDGETVFPGLHQKSLHNLLRKITLDVTVHGFRSSFGTWCEDNEVPPELREAALAHEKGSEVIKAYARSKLVEPRRSIMEKWGDHCTGQFSSNNVVNLKRIGAGHDGRPAL